MFVALIAAAFSLSAANPKQAAGHPDATANRDVASALNNVAVAINKKPETSPHDEPCAKDSDNRSSDLCAQWKAADAAKYAADVAFWLGIVGTVLGGLTLYVAVRAALYAKSAAEHTESGAKETRRQAEIAENALEMSRSQMRPYVNFGDTFVDIPLTLDSNIRVKIKNHGTSPALNLTVGMATQFVTCPIGEQASNLPIADWENVGALAGQAETVAVLSLDVATKEQLASIVRGEGAFVTHMVMRYHGTNICDFDEEVVSLDRHSAKTGEILILTEWGRKADRRLAQGEMSV